MIPLKQYKKDSQLNQIIQSSSFIKPKPLLSTFNAQLETSSSGRLSETRNDNPNCYACKEQNPTVHTQRFCGTEETINCAWGDEKEYIREKVAVKKIKLFRIEKKIAPTRHNALPKKQKKKNPAIFPICNHVNNLIVVNEFCAS